MKKAVSLYIANYTIWNSPSLVNLMSALSDNYELKIFITNTANENIAFLKNNKYKFYLIESIPFEFSLHYFFYQIRSALYFFKWLLSKKENLFCICIDVKGYCQYHRLSSHTPYFYYSLELQIDSDVDPDELLLPFRESFTYEKNNFNSPKGVLIQSESRKNVFFSHYQLEENPYFYLPVTYLDSSISENKNYIRDKYGVENDKTIVLYSGGIHPYYKVLEIINSVKDNPSIVLFFQGFTESDYVKSIFKLVKEEDVKNVIFSEDRFDNIEDVSIVYQSCDIGIAWYDYESLNFKTAATSSGKIAGYFKYGLPVIINNSCGGKDAVENINCGFSVQTYDEINHAIDMINADYNKFSTSARSTYDEFFNFRNYEEDLIFFLES